MIFFFDKMDMDGQKGLQYFSKYQNPKFPTYYYLEKKDHFVYYLLSRYLTLSKLKRSSNLDIFLPFLSVCFRPF